MNCLILGQVGGSKIAPKIGRYRVGQDRQVKNGQKTWDVINGRSQEQAKTVSQAASIQLLVTSLLIQGGSPPCLIGQGYLLAIILYTLFIELQLPVNGKKQARPFSPIHTVDSRNGIKISQPRYMQQVAIHQKQPHTRSSWADFNHGLVVHSFRVG